MLFVPCFGLTSRRQAELLVTHGPALIDTLLSHPTDSIEDRLLWYQLYKCWREPLLGKLLRRTPLAQLQFLLEESAALVLDDVNSKVRFVRTNQTQHRLESRRRNRVLPSRSLRTAGCWSSSPCSYTCTVHPKP